MKRFLALFLLLLEVSSCRGLVLEDRLECPSFLFFEVSNPERFEPYDKVYTTVCGHPAGNLISSESPSLGSIQDKAFYVEVRRTEAVKGSTAETVGVDPAHPGWSGRPGGRR